MTAFVKWRIFFSVDIIIKSEIRNILYWLQFCIADDLIQVKFIQLMKVINSFAKLVISHQKVIILIGKRLAIGKKLKRITNIFNSSITYWLFRFAKIYHLIVYP